jgi:sarcosine oxidase subunit gamma
MSAWLRAATPERRCGVKGAGAAQLLAELGFTVPKRPNTWTPLHRADRDDSDNVIARLGNTEFFIEEQGGAAGIAALEARLADGVAGAYPVLREDAALVLGGARAETALAQVCNVNLAGLVIAAKPIAMTLMIGVGVLVLPQLSERGPVYRIWCDPSFGPYLKTELEEIIEEILPGSAQ